MPPLNRWLSRSYRWAMESNRERTEDCFKAKEKWEKENGMKDLPSRYENWL
jgi:hypothetical protein